MPWFSRHQTGRPPHPDVLTPAEWRVLEQVRAGRSNPEIAEALGVSVNTVKSQVSSMLSKLELRDRSELAAWDGAPAEASRAALGRLHVAGPLGWLVGSGRTWGGRALVGAGAMAVGALFVVAMQAMDGSAGGSGVPAATPTGTATAGESEADVEPLVMPFAGVSADPRPLSTPSEVVSVGAPPAPQFTREPDSREVVLYDWAGRVERRLGDGGFTRFSPGGTWFAWIAFTNPPSVMEGELHVIELATGEERTVGEARALRWLDDDRVIAYVRGNEMAVIDVRTGDYGDPGSLNLNPEPLREEAAGVRLEDVSPEATGAPPWRRQYRLTFLDGSSSPVEFEAYRARLSPDGMVVMGIAPPDAEADLPSGTTVVGNIYLGDPATLEAEYVASALMSYGTWPLDASEEFVFWTDDRCGREAVGGSRFFDRESGEIVGIDARLNGEFIPSGALVVGEGRQQIFDPWPGMMGWRLSVVDDPHTDVFWSPDYGFSAMGYTPGGGGSCG